jgi:hypothetical protein
MKKINREYDDFKNGKAAKETDSDYKTNNWNPKDWDAAAGDESDYEDFDTKRKKKFDEDYRKGKQQKENADYNVYDFIDEYYSKTKEEKELAMDYYHEISNTHDGPVNEFNLMCRAIEHAMYLIENKKCKIENYIMFADILNESINEVKNNGGSFRSSEYA